MGTPDSSTFVEEALGQALAGLDLESLRGEYLSQGEMLYLDGFLPPTLLGRCRAELAALLPHVHRNYIPRHKKGGSVGFPTIAREAPTLAALYLSPALFGFVGSLSQAPIQYCPESDLHRCALYAYTEPGDHIGLHYDTSYYRDRRYTVLLGLEDESSSDLLCRLHTREKGREPKELRIKTLPGTLVVFNGDKLHHSVTPLGEAERRYVLTLQYVTSTKMNPFLRFVSNMKDAIAYFGFGQVFGRRTPER